MKIRLISWNINMFRPDKPELKNKIINEINQQVSNEDFIILIESSFEFVNDLLRTELKNKYNLLSDFALSHGGLIHILYNRNLNESNLQRIEITIDNPTLLIRYVKDNIVFYLAGCHLAPFAENSQRRIEELLIVRTMVPENEHLILIGDMNIREKETKFLEKSDNILGVVDSGDKRKTWYRYFFEPDNINITSRFDRLFFSKNISLDRFELFGKKYNNKKMELLSDHLAIKAQVNIN